MEKGPVYEMHRWAERVVNNSMVVPWVSDTDPNPLYGKNYHYQQIVEWFDNNYPDGAEFLRREEAKEELEVSRPWNN